VNDTLRDTLMIEAVNLLTGHVILEEHWSCFVTVVDFEPIICGDQSVSRALEAAVV